MTGGLYLYVIRFGDRTKVGISANVGRRLGDHARAARAAGVWFEHVLTLEPHAEARANERTLVRQFSSSGSEYLDADPLEVASAARALPHTPAEVGAPAEPAPVPDSFTVTDTIRAELARRQLTETAAAQAVGLSDQVWSDRMVRPGYWRIGQLDALANWLGVALAELLDGGSW